ncbi:hypothetical protein L7F22_038220 [Adiantum nelumboides]|nr:hypothetical protein [Adiantum nelumboides]
MYQEKIQNLSARDTWEYMDHKENYEASYAMALKATESVFVRKGLEIAVIANPDNGFDFFCLCISFPSWDERGCKMTTFRVSEIARAHITSQEGLQDIRRLFGSLSYTGQMDPNARLGGVRSCGQTCLPTAKLMQGLVEFHCGMYSRMVLFRVYQSVFTIAAEFLLDDGALVVACRAVHLFKVISKTYEFQSRHIRSLFLCMPLHTYVMDCDFIVPVATLIVAMFVRDLDGPLSVLFYDRQAGNIAADIDVYEADSDMLREPLQESSWTLDTSGAAFRSGVEKSEFFASWLIGTCTTVGDVVLDCLAGCGGMATECKRLHRHCISIEKDVMVFRSLLFSQQRLPGEVGTILHYGHFSRSKELERATSLQFPAHPPIPHFYPPSTPQPPSIAQWPYGPSYPPPYTFKRPHSTWPPVMGGRPPL